MKRTSALEQTSEKEAESLDALVLLSTVNRRRPDHQRHQAGRGSAVEDAVQHSARALGRYAQPALLDRGVVGAERHNDPHIGFRQ